jgi:hypothetical protein
MTGAIYHLSIRYAIKIIRGLENNKQALIGVNSLHIAVKFHRIGVKSYHTNVE